MMPARATEGKMPRFLSLGAGVQSVTLALMAARGEIKAPDCAIFADTGDEKRGTYRYLDWLTSQLPYPVLRVRRSAASLSESTLALYRDGSGFDQTPPFFFPGGMLAKHCSKEWKTRIVIKEIRRMLCIDPRERAPRGTHVEVLIGISRDEAHRMKPSEVPWISNQWPLIDKGMRRAHCVKWLTDLGYPVPPRSACVYCPFQSDAEFAEMKANPADDDWSRITAFDSAIRPGGNGTTGPLYVHRDCRPVAEIAFGAQSDLFGMECGGACGT